MRGKIVMIGSMKGGVSKTVSNLNKEYENLPGKHICYYDSVESVRQRRALEAKNFRGFLRE